MNNIGKQIELENKIFEKHYKRIKIISTIGFIILGITILVWMLVAIKTLRG